MQAPAAPPPSVGNGARLQIMVPAGCAPGSRVEFRLPDGRSMEAEVPPGMRPGQTFSVVAPDPPGQAPAPAPIPAPPQEPPPEPPPEIAPPPIAPPRIGGEGDGAADVDGSSPSGTAAAGISIRHSASGVISNEVVTLREGYLQKQGQIRKSWKKRWFVLKSDGQMPYYKNENSASRGEDPLGVVQIGTDGLSVAGGEAEAAAAGRAHVFRLHQPGSSGGGSSSSSKEFVLAGVDRADTEGWINAIERRYQLQREVELGLLNPGAGSGERPRLHPHIPCECCDTLHMGVGSVFVLLS